MVVAMKLDVPQSTGGSAQSANLKLDFQLQDLNDSQDIKATESTKPLSELMSKLQGLGIPGLSTGGGTSSSSSGTSQENLQKYSECIQKANGDNSKIRKCADLLTP